MATLWRAVLFLIFITVSYSGKVDEDFLTNAPCYLEDFRCDNGLQCADKSYRCDNETDCDDLSDEQNCDKELTDLFRFEWIERKRERASSWLAKQSELGFSDASWGYNAVRTTVALYLTNQRYFVSESGTSKILAYELRLQMLAKLALRNIDDVLSTEIASFLNAFIIVCIDPRDFHGMDLVAELRSRVDAEDYTNPFVILSLCNAGDNITERDVLKLKEAFSLAHRELWTDIQAYAVMALSCASTQQNSTFDIRDITDFTTPLKMLQNTKGTIDNLKSTGLVLQALISAGDFKDAEFFDVDKAFEVLTNSQEKDGSFEDILKSYYVLPVFNYKSLINISAIHCKPKNDKDIFRKWRRQLGEKKHIKYSLWLGEDKYLQRTLYLMVPADINFYKIMEVSARLDDKYKFKTVVRHEKPYVYSISSIEDDPENGKFWFPFFAAGSEDNITITPIEKSPIDYVPGDKEHLVFWYRKGIFA